MLIFSSSSDVLTCRYLKTQLSSARTSIFVLHVTSTCHQQNSPSQETLEQLENAAPVNRLTMKLELARSPVSTAECSEHCGDLKMPIKMVPILLSCCRYFNLPAELFLS